MEDYSHRKKVCRKVGTDALELFALLLTYTYTASLLHIQIVVFLHIEMVLYLHIEIIVGISAHRDGTIPTHRDVV